jgi:epimerase transport system membrane fusion protein
MFEDLKNVYRWMKSVVLNPVSHSMALNEAEIAESDAHLRRFGYGVIAFVFGGVGIWAVLAPLESAALGEGTVQVEGNRKAVQHLDGGIVSEILVANGDFVERGQALLRLDDTLILAEKNIVESRYWASRAEVDRLIAERDGSPTVAFAEWLVGMADDRAVTAVDNEQAMFAARLANRDGEIAVLEQRISQLNSRIIGTRSVLSAKQTVVKSLDGELTDLKALLEDGFVDKQRILQLERSLAQSVGEVDDLTATISASEVAILEAELEIIQLKKRFTAQVVDELTLTQNELFDYQQRLTALSIQLERTKVRAPVTGLVMAISPNGPGEVVGAGEELMEIVPDTEELVVSTKLSIMDRDRLSIGQEAEVRFSVFKDSYSVTGELVTLSADSLLDEVTGTRYYEGKVALLSEDMVLLDGNELAPGMPAMVLIKTGNRTLMGYLTSPLQRMFEASLIED